MAIWDKLFGEFVDVIEWTDDSNDTLVYRFERYGNEIKYGAKLTVREGQSAIFVNEGEVADVLGPGMYELETKNLPMLSTLQGWKHGFESPFKAEVYFCSTRRFTDLKWGTKNPVMVRDAEFGPVRLRAFGTYAVRIADPALFLREIVGTDGHFTVDEISNQLRNLIVSRFASVVGTANIPVLDMAGNYDQFSQFIHGRIGGEFGAYGLELTKLLVENISLPPEVEKALDKRSSMGIVGNLDAYLKYQSAEAVANGANNPGGGGGISDAMSMGLGLAVGQQMSDSLRKAPSTAPAATAAASPPPLPGGSQYYVGVNNKPTGPFTLSALRQEQAAGRLGPDSLVWAEGMDGWTTASQVAELAPLFRSAGPPPLPGA
jgi:membrane protease subunit (stomatin/prohibitin family)